MSDSPVVLGTPATVLVDPSTGLPYADFPVRTPGSGSFPAAVVTPAPVNAGATPTLPFSLIDPISGALTSAIREYLVEIGFRGNVGAYLGHRRITALGNNADVDTTTFPEDVWSGGGLYPWMTAATSLEVVCASADDAAAGTGARTITIQGLKADYTELSQTITLNGTTPVAVPTQLYRINASLILSAGSGGVNAGDITIRDVGGGTTRAIIPLGFGITRQSAFTVPAGNTLQILSQIFSINRSGGGVQRFATFQTFFRNAVTGLYRLPLELSISDQNPYRHDGAPGITLAEKTDFCHRCAVVSADNTNVSGGWLGVMRLNTLI